MCAKFWPNTKMAQPNTYPSQVVWDCFECDEAYIGDIEYCPKCKAKLAQLYPFHGVGVRECSIVGKER